VKNHSHISEYGGYLKVISLLEGTEFNTAQTIRCYRSTNQEYTVELQFQDFPHLMFAFWSLRKSLTYAMHKLPHFTVSPFRVTHAFSGQKSVLVPSQYPDLLFSGLCVLFAQGLLLHHQLVG
jgi:hypothetical protein